MANLKQWDDNVEAMSDEQLESRKQALLTLQSWEMFNAEFKWTCIFVLITTIDCEQKRRARNKVA